MYTATLRCGTVLDYEARNFLPRAGELVPCRCHGYCAVDRVGHGTSRDAHGSALPRARPRDQRELVDWLSGHPVTTVAALRRQRFSLRMVAAAEREGHLVADLRTGRVLARRSAEAVAWRSEPPDRPTFGDAVPLHEVWR